MAAILQKDLPYYARATQKAESQVTSAEDVRALARTLEEFISHADDWKPEDDLVDIRRILCNITVRHCPV